MSLHTTLIGWHDGRVEFRDVTHLHRWAIDENVQRMELFLVDDAGMVISPVTARLVEGRMRIENLLGDTIAEAAIEPLHTERQRRMISYLEGYFEGTVGVVAVALDEWVSDRGRWEPYGFRRCPDAVVFVCAELVDAQAAYLDMDDDEFDHWVSCWALKLQLSIAADLSDLDEAAKDDVVDQQLAVATIDGFAFFYEVTDALDDGDAPRPLTFR